MWDRGWWISISGQVIASVWGANGRVTVTKVAEPDLKTDFLLHIFNVGLRGCKIRSNVEVIEAKLS